MGPKLMVEAHSVVVADLLEGGCYRTVQRGKERYTADSIGQKNKTELEWDSEGEEESWPVDEDECCQDGLEDPTDVSWVAEVQWKTLALEETSI
jgi:hypothetical protein